MIVSDFLNKVEEISKSQPDIKLYPYGEGEKLYSRFLGRIFTLNNDVLQVVKSGWLKEIYDKTNGLDLRNFYILPFNNYFNKKSFSFDSFSWVVNPDNPNEIIADFYPFMTDGKTIIGFYAGTAYGTIKDSNNNLLIAIAKKERRIVTDLTFIASSIYLFLDNVMEQLKTGKPLLFTEDIAYWCSLDSELSSLYENNKILEHKLTYMWQDESDNYKSYVK